MDRIKEIIEESIQVKRNFLQDSRLVNLIHSSAEFCIESLAQGGKILLCGNGGSAADAQHIAAELSGRFQYDRDPLYAEALHVNGSYLTAVANDYSFNEIYSRLVKGMGKPNDVLIALSTSGNSENVLRAVQQAKAQQMTTIGFTGISGGNLATHCDLCIKVPSENTARIQEMHMLIGHILCEKIEKTLFPK